MNERIKELRRQATLVETYTSHDGSVHEGKSVDLEKFAELIVQECMDRVNKAGFAFNEQPQYNDNQNALVSEGFFWGLESVKQQVKEHFGVEE
jgi:hypothetical protein